MKLFSRDKPNTTSVPPELQQYYQVPQQTVVHKKRPIIVILLAVVVAAVLIGGVIWLISYNPVQSSDSKQSSTSQKAKNPAKKPGSSTVNTQPIAQPSVQ